MAFVVAWTQTEPQTVDHLCMYMHTYVYAYYIYIHTYIKIYDTDKHCIRER